MAMTIGTLTFQSAGSEAKRETTLAADNNYQGGYVLNASQFALSQITRLKLQPEQGFEFDTEYVSPFQVKVHVFQGGSGTTGSTSGGTPAGTVAAPVFSGADPGALGTKTVFHAAAPAGNNVYVGLNKDMSGYFNADNAVSGIDEVQAFSATAKCLLYDNGAVPAGAQVYFREATSILVANLVGTPGADVYISLTDGNVVKVTSDAGAGGAGDVALVYNDGAPHRFEATFANGLDHLISTTPTKAWIAPVPSGLNTAPAFTGAALAGHTHAIGAGAGSEVPNGTNLAALTAIECEVYGF